MTPEQLKFWNRLAQSLLGISVAGGLAWYALINHYYETLPRLPDPATGHIYFYNFHGIGIYETHGQFILENAIEYSSMSLFCIVFFFGVWKLKWRALKK